MNQRRQDILDLLRKNSILSIEEISKEIYASHSTIRRDLIYLDKYYPFITRIKGGAAYIKNPEEISLMHRMTVNKSQKEEIAKLALELIIENQMIFIDSSTTCLELAHLIQSRMKNITILSNGLKTDEILSKNNDIVTIATGGIVNSNSLTMVGPNTYGMINNYVADIFFLSGKALNEFGLLENSAEEAYVKKAFIKNSHKLVLLLDSSKFNLSAKNIVAQLNEIDIIISDKMPDDEMLDLLFMNNIKLITMDSEPG